MNLIMVKILQEKVLQLPEQSFAVFQEKGVLLNCAYHAHPEYELTCVGAGAGALFVGTELLSFHPGMLTLFGPGVPHHYINNAENADLFGVQFAHDFAGAFFWKLPEFSRVARMLDEARGGLIFGEAAAAKGQSMLESIRAENGDPTRKFLVFLELLTQLSGAERTEIWSESVISSGDADLRIQRGITAIQEHIVRNSPFSLQTIARSQNLSPDVFSRYFARATGMSYIAYVNRLRIGKAARNLQSTKKSVSEICFECGFRNLANFNRIFRKLKGMPPSEFRDKWR